MKFISAVKLLLISCLVISSYSNAQPIKSKQGFINVTGGAVWYNILGSGNNTPLLLIHGGPGGSSCALASLAQLGTQRQVIFYDQLGAGKSEQPDDLSLWNVDRFVEELDTVRKTLHLEKVHLLAHSWGAAIAGQYLLDKSTKGIESVIFVGPYLSSDDWIESTNALRQQLSPATQAILHKHELAGTTASDEYQIASEEFYKLFLYRQPHTDPPECKDSAWNQTIYETMWGNSEFFVSGNLKQFNIAKNLSRINVPTLFIVGQYDEIQESKVLKYQQQMPQASITVIKDAAHMSMIDQPDIFLKTVDNFLQKTDKTKKVQ